MKLIDNLLKIEFIKHNIYKGGGTEFYVPEIKELIEPFLQNMNIEYKILTDDEIDNMTRKERFYEIMKKYNLKKQF